MKARARVLGQGKDTVGSNDTYLLKHTAPVKNNSNERMITFKKSMFCVFHQLGGAVVVCNSQADL